MAQMRLQERSRRHERPSSPVLAVLANASAVCPLFLLGLLYGQWLLSWWVLGHQPRPSLDDPKDMPGADWMHFATGLALAGHVPLLLVAAVLNTLLALRDRNPGFAAALRLGCVVAPWLGTLLLLRLDPALVVAWWLD